MGGKSLGKKEGEGREGRTREIGTKKNMKGKERKEQEGKGGKEQEGKERKEQEGKGSKEQEEKRRSTSQVFFSLRTGELLIPASISITPLKLFSSNRR